ncbi:protein of unknown function [Xenorhabdus doucetiae]|uniref:Uncharacterized protein n=1 Tax=Xenorhabdus doucetiae TaxID=351671 RepID=A0A068QQL7_9GAMM|nr:protein of unknown function [Xenorhabdus doucetiae]
MVTLTLFFNIILIIKICENTVIITMVKQKQLIINDHENLWRK